MILPADNNESLIKRDKSSEYVSVTLGNTKLLAIRSEIYLIEPVDDKIQIKKSVLSTGRIELDGRIIPVYFLTEDLKIEQTASIEKPVCIVLKHDTNYVGILCSEATPFNHQIVKIQSLPECMKSTVRPIVGLCLSKSNDITEVNFLVSVQALLEYIDEYQSSRV